VTATILGIDPSLTGTGFARLELNSAGWHGVTWTDGRDGKRNESLIQRDDRIDRIADNLRLDSWDLSAAGIEEPAYGAPGGSTWDRAGLWWRLAHRVLTYDVPLMQVNTRIVQKFAVGRAHTKKNPVDKADVAMAVAKMWPDVVIQGNNAADALVIASVIAAVNDLPVPFDLPKYRTDVVSGLRLPEKEAA
jgi:crossover junction endodeoxyribonuclease RuvC